MKRFLLSMILIITFNGICQYDSELKIINKACYTTIDNLGSLFIGFDYQEINGLFVYSDDENDKYYVIELIDGYNVVSYIEAFSLKNYRLMKKSVKSAEQGCYYVVSKSRENDTISITSTVY